MLVRVRFADCGLRLPRARCTHPARSHLARSTNATGHPIPTPAITAGQSTVVLDAGGSPCAIALQKYCPGEFQQGPACWQCARAEHGNATKAAGCDKGAFKAYCGPQKLDPEAGTGPRPVLAAHRALLRAGSLHLGGGGVCKSGNYTCATIEHYAAFAPAFGRRPYVSEKNLSIVVQTDFSLSGATLRVATTIAGVPLHGEVRTLLRAAPPPPDSAAQSLCAVRAMRPVPYTSLGGPTFGRNPVSAW